MPPIEFNVPVLGERRDLTDRELPPQAMRLCQNMWRNERGNLVIRPGYELLSGTNPEDRIMGIHYFKSANGTNRMIAVTLTKVWSYTYASDIWEDISGAGSLNGSAISSHGRCATFNVSGTVKVIITNGADSVKLWNPADAAYAACGGSPTGTPVDVKVAANRALLLRTPFSVQVSEFNNPESYPSSNGFNVNLIDCGDFGIGMEQFDRTSIAIFGEESQWMARAQAGNVPFRYERITNRSGPLSPAAIVSAGGAIYYLARDYNVYRFDGVSCEPVGWAMKPFVEDNIDQGNQMMTHGCYHDRHGKIVWVFPPDGSTLPSFGVFFDIRTGEMGRIIYGAGITASARTFASTGVTWGSLTGYTWDTIATDYPTWDSFGFLSTRREVALGDYTGQVHISGAGDGSDNGAAIEGVWEAPLKSYGGWENNFTPDTAETFFKAAANSTTVELSCGYTDTLMTDPAYMAMGSFDLSTNQRNDIDLTSLGEKRFLTIRHRVSAPKGQVTWQGMLLTGEPAGVEKGPTS